MIKRTMLRLQGQGRGTLALEAGDTLQYQLNSSIAVNDAKLVLFFDTENYQVVEGQKGELSSFADHPIQAAAVVQGSAFLLTGAYEQFDWSAAKRYYLHRSEGAPHSNSAGQSSQNEQTVQEILDVIATQEKEVAAPMVFLDAVEETEKEEEAIHPFKTEEKFISVGNMPAEDDAVPMQTSEILQKITNAQSIKNPDAPAKRLAFSEANKDIALPREVTDTDACVLPEEEFFQPFSYVLPQSYWKKISYPYNLGAGYYLTGQIYKEDALVGTAIAVPGGYAVTSPPWLEGFQTYLEDVQSKVGYWVFFRDAQTGESATLQSFT